MNASPSAASAPPHLSQTLLISKAISLILPAGHLALPFSRNDPDSPGN
jgi:hypothetical protein